MRKYSRSEQKNILDEHIESKDELVESESEPELTYEKLEERRDFWEYLPPEFFLDSFQSIDDLHELRVYLNVLKNNEDNLKEFLDYFLDNFSYEIERLKKQPLEMLDAYDVHARGLSKYEYILHSLESSLVRNLKWREEWHGKKDNEINTRVQGLIEKMIQHAIKEAHIEFFPIPAYKTVDDLEEDIMVKMEFDEGNLDEVITSLIYDYGHYGDKESYKFLVSLLDQLPAECTTKSVAYSLSKINPHEGAKALLEKIHTSTDPEKTKVYSRVLFHLELGEVSVSNGTLEYLQKKYNLKGELKDGVVSAIRITSDGKIGLLNENKELVGYIEFGDFEADEVEKEALVMEISNDLLSITKKSSQDTTDEFEQQKQEFLKGYHAEFYQKYVQGKLGIPVNNLKLREQFWLFQFLRKQKDNEELIETLAKYGDLYKEGFLRAFIALESSDALGDVILQLAKNFETEPGLGREVFDRFADFVAFIDLQAEQIIQTYQDIFYKKTIDEGAVRKALLDRSTQFLEEVNKRITSERQSKVQVVHEVSQYIQKEFTAQTSSLQNLADTQRQLNSLYSELAEIVSSYEDGQGVQDELLQQYNLPEHIRHQIKNERKFDGVRIEKMIDEYKEIYQLDEKDHSIMVEMKGEEAVRIMTEQLKKEYEPKVKKLERLLLLQKAFEKKMDMLVYGKESASLPSHFLEEVVQNAQEYKREVETDNKEVLYFPVGISKDVLSWEKVLSGEMKAAHPVEVYSYLLWLHNQGRPVQLVVCDTVQMYNYSRNTGMGMVEAREKALAIGEQEAKFYAQAIHELGLKNITIDRYDEVKKSSQFNENETSKSKQFYREAGKTPFDYYLDLCAKLASLPHFQEAFTAVVQTSATDGERDIRYGLDEVAFILSNPGKKVSHMNEARYDILVAFIQEFERKAEEAKIDLMEIASSLPEDIRHLQNNGETSEIQLAQIFQEVLQNFRDFLNEKKSAQGKKKGNIFAEYLMNADEVLKKIKPVKMEKQKVSRAEKTVKKKLQGDVPKVEFSFVVPSVDSQSFGWRTSAVAKQETIKFKEPYSTYFYTNSADMFAGTDQVVGVKDGNIGGKVLTLERKNQEEYARRVLKPLLVEYVRALDTVTPSYFMRVGKTKEDIVSEMKQCETLNDILRFIQQYIVSSEISVAPQQASLSQAA